MAETDPFTLNILGPTDLIETPTNKVFSPDSLEEGVTSEFTDPLDLDMTDEELLELRRGYENKSAPYTGKIQARQKINKQYLFGTQRVTQTNKVVPNNLLFQATATFVPQALAKNPEPVVWSDNTNEGKQASSDIKTMLQFHADTLCMRKKLGILVWHWSVYFLGVWKYGWNPETEDISIEVRKPSNFVLDPDGFIDEYGDYQGAFLGERIQCTAEELIGLYPKHTEYISLKAGGKLGTLVTRTEWWNNKYCFTTFEEKVLDKHKNEFFNYDDRPNHFATPKMPYTFLSVFSLQEQPHDFTNLVEQNISNQDSINDRDAQISKNLAHGNNAIAVSSDGFTVETAHQAADALERGDPILVSGNVDQNIKRIPANAIPDGVFQAQDRAKDSLLSVYGVFGTTAQEADQDTTARGMILNQSHDSDRIGGGVGEALEQIADNAFNWLVQLYYVFYDEKRYAAIMGAGRAVEYIALTMANEDRRYVISVAPNSMKPKDEISERNLAVDLWNKQALDPISLYKMLDDPDPMETAKRVATWVTNPQLYMQQYFPEENPMMDSANPPNPLDINQQSPPVDESLSQEPANASLSNVPLT